MDQKSDSWNEVLKQMDRAAKPPPGQCADACKNPVMTGHIYCSPCYLRNRGYNRAQNAR